MRVRTPARKVHVVPVAIPGLIHHHLSLENRKAAGLRIEESVGDAHQMWPVHEQDRTASCVELPLPSEDDALNIPASMKVGVKTKKDSRVLGAYAPAEA